MSWLAMLILGVLTQVAVAVVQLDRLRPQALALFVFTSAFAATVVLIGLSEAILPSGHRCHGASRGGGIGNTVTRKAAATRPTRI